MSHATVTIARAKDKPIGLSWCGITTAANARAAIPVRALIHRWIKFGATSSCVLNVFVAASATKARQATEPKESDEMAIYLAVTKATKRARSGL